MFTCGRAGGWRECIIARFVAVDDTVAAVGVSGAIGLASAISADIEIIAEVAFFAFGHLCDAVAAANGE